jgi:hypothetical protein
LTVLAEDNNEDTCKEINSSAVIIEAISRKLDEILDN